MAVCVASVAPAQLCVFACHDCLLLLLALPCECHNFGHGSLPWLLAAPLLLSCRVYERQQPWRAYPPPFNSRLTAISQPCHQQSHSHPTTVSQQSHHRPISSPSSRLISHPISRPISHPISRLAPKQQTTASGDTFYPNTDETSPTVGRRDTAAAPTRARAKGE
jgi:hypothetical protein